MKAKLAIAAAAMVLTAGCFHSVSLDVYGWNYTPEPVDLTVEILDAENKSVSKISMGEIPANGHTKAPEKVRLKPGVYRVVAQTHNRTVEDEHELSSSNFGVSVAIRASSLEITYGIT